MQHEFEARKAICADWGFRSGWEALAKFEEADGAVDKAPVTPALSFTDKAGYLAARAAWRARHKAIEAQIREAKAARRVGTEYERGDAQSTATIWAVLARAALLERALQKKKAAQQWAAAKEAVAVEAMASA